MYIAPEGQEAQHRVIVLAERERIAQDLHDLVIQRLFATGLSLQAITKDPELPERDLDRVREAIDNLDSTVQQIRNSVSALQNQDSVHSLRSRIQAEINSLRSSSAMIISCEFNGPVDTVIVGEVAEQVFAVVRVIDDGVGFKEGALRSGLANLECRAEKLQGSFEIHGVPRGGTEAIWRAKL